MEQARTHNCVEKRGPCSICSSISINPQSCDLHLCEKCWLLQCKKSSWDNELSACANRICDLKRITLNERRELNRKQISKYLGLKRPVKSGHIARPSETSNLRPVSFKQITQAKPTKEVSTQDVTLNNNKRKFYQISSDEEGESLSHAPIPIPPIVSAPYLDIQGAGSTQELGINVINREIFLPNFVCIQDRDHKYDQCMFSLCQNEIEFFRNDAKLAFDNHKDTTLVRFLQKWSVLFQKKILYIHSFLQAEASKKKDMLMYYYFRVNDPSSLAIIQCLVNSSDITRHYMFLYKELSNAYKFFNDQAKISSFRPIIFYRVTLGKFILMVRKPSNVTTTNFVSLPLKKRPIA